MCAGHQHPPREEPNLAAFLGNLRHGEGGLPGRLRTAMANLLRRRSRQAGCCGNYGDPGC